MIEAVDAGQANKCSILSSPVGIMKAGCLPGRPLGTEHVKILTPRKITR